MLAPWLRKCIQHGKGIYLGEPKANPDKFWSQSGYIFAAMALTYFEIYPVNTLTIYHYLQNCKLDILVFVIGV